MQTLLNAFLLVVSPSQGWRKIADQPSSALTILLLQTLPLALIPAVCWYFGITRSGWEVAGEVMRLTPESALPMMVLFYLAMIGGVIFLGLMVRWMSITYGDQGQFVQGIKLISYTATPFFLAGVLGLYPLLWLDIALGTLVAGYCIYLLYLGVSDVMRVGRERGFLYASAVFAVALVSFVGLLTATVLVWEFGPAPEYTY